MAIVRRKSHSTEPLGTNQQCRFLLGCCRGVRCSYCRYELSHHQLSNLSCELQVSSYSRERVASSRWYPSIASQPAFASLTISHFLSVIPTRFSNLERQQHAWYMTDGFGTLESQVKQIQNRIDWLVKAGFHFLSTESGFSEFTHPDCSVMVAWMNATAEYMRNTYNRRTFIKAHISTVRFSGQICWF